MIRNSTYAIAIFSGQQIENGFNWLENHAYFINIIILLQFYGSLCGLLYYENKFEFCEFQLRLRDPRAQGSLFKIHSHSKRQSINSNQF